MNYIKIVEDTLGVELSEKALQNYEPNPYHLSELADRLKAHYAGFKMYEKDTGTFRPYISPRYELGDQATLAYRSRVGKPELLQEFTMESTAKKLLLYAHEICLHDPLVYLLDYFKLVPQGQLSKDRIPTIVHILKELAHLKPLIERGIIHIVSDEVFTGINDWNIIKQFDEFKPLIVTQLGAAKFDDDIFEEMIKSLYEQSKLDNDIDLYFPTSDFTEQYKALLRGFNEKFTSEQTRDPLRIGELAGLQLVSTRQLSVTDLIHIREDDKIFEQWRLLIKDTLQELWNTKADYSDGEAEFRKVLKEQDQKLNLDILKQARKSTFYNNIPKFKEKVGIGLISSTVLHMTLPPDFTPSMGSLMNTLFSALLEQANTLINPTTSNRARKAVNKHFLILKK